MKQSNHMSDYALIQVIYTGYEQSTDQQIIQTEQSRTEFDHKSI